LFKLTSLNLNGLRSAATKGVADWVAELAPDCICMQEIRVQASDIEGRFEEMAGLKGHFHFAQKKGYAGTAIYSRHEPSGVVIGWGDQEFDAEGRYLELRFDTPTRKFSVISCYFPSGSSGEERQAASSGSWRASSPTCWHSSASASSCCAATSTSPTRKPT